MRLLRAEFQRLRTAARPVAPRPAAHTRYRGDQKYGGTVFSHLWSCQFHPDSISTRADSSAGADIPVRHTPALRLPGF